MAARSGEDGGELVCAFTVDGDLYALPVVEVVEVVKTPRLSPVPGSHPAVAGLVNLRGSVLVAVDARQRLNRDGGAGPGPVAVVAASGRSRVALLVDAVADIMTVADDDQRDVPAGLADQARAVTRYVTQTPRGLMSVLDAEELWRWAR